LPKHKNVVRFALIFINASAAAVCFVGGLLMASVVPDPLGIGTVVLGLVGLGYFVNRAERVRRATD
jgi:hypothetical protein